jgi:sulfonate transport system ATP-binding protein
MFAGVLGYDILYGNRQQGNVVTEQPAAIAPRRTEGLRVSLRAVRKSYDSRTVLGGLDVEIEPGSFVAMIGRSGEGKSTLLRLLAGLDVPDAGAVLLDGGPVGRRAHDVTMMFQDARLLPWQRVLGNVGLARGRDWRARALAALEAVGLAERAGDWPAQLSGGQRQRIALARALLDRPGLLLLDEPFGALDALTRGEMHTLLLRLWRETRFTAVLVTHDVSEAVALADRVLILRKGGVVCDVSVALPRPRATVEAFAIQQELLRSLRGFEHDGLRLGRSGDF